jgi:hypothetical protein
MRRSCSRAMCPASPHPLTLISSQPQWAVPESPAP